MSKVGNASVQRRLAGRPAGDGDEAERWLRVFEVLQVKLRLEDDDEYTKRVKRLRRVIKEQRGRGVCGNLLAVAEVKSAQNAARQVLINRLRSLLGR
jgi:hypothetical protein